MMNLFVGNLPYNVDDFDLEDLFREFGDVRYAKIVRDNDSKQSKGFGFVKMLDEVDAEKAIKALNGYELMGRRLKVNKAKNKK